MTLDKTWQEIYDAFPNAIVKYETSSENGMFGISAVTSVPSGTGYGVAVELHGPVEFYADSPNGYPSHS